MNNCVTAPLTDLVKKGSSNKVEWREPRQKAFNELKQALGNAPILRVPDLLKIFLNYLKIKKGKFESSFI